MLAESNLRKLSKYNRKITLDLRNMLAGKTWNISALPMLVYLCKGSLTYQISHSLCQNDAKFQTHPPSTLHVKMPNLSKIDVYNFRYRISVGILMKLSFLSHKCINK